METTIANPKTGSAARSTGAVFLGLISVIVLSLCTDQVLHVLKVYPPWTEPMPQPGLNLLALSYRLVYSIFGSWIAARFAPRNPMRHAMILGVIGTILSVVGIITTLPMHLGPAWYPISLAVSALPCAWLGGKLHRPRAAGGSAN